MARALGENEELSYFYFWHDCELTAKELPFCRRLTGIPKPTPYTTAKILRGLFGRNPLSVVNYASPEMADALARLAAECSFDIVHVDSVHMMQYVPLLGKAAGRVVFNWHNIESELLTRYAANANSGARRLYATMTARRLERLEGEMLETGFGHLVCSERDRQQLLERAPGARIAVIENGVDVAQFQHTAGNTRRRVLFVGMMSYHANAVGAIWFADSIWPKIHALHPDWVLTVVGADPPPAVRALDALDGVEVTGTVPDVTPYYDEALMAVVPLKTGSGTRLKILEAMAAGVPVISTALGAEGLAVTPGEHLLIAETPSEWIEACSTLTTEQGRTRLTESARQLVAARYDWQVIGQNLVETYRRWRAVS
jgi:glycosyltransferase involved in cell wall biosynthesis